MRDDASFVSADLVAVLRARLVAMEDDKIVFPIRLGVDETEDVIRILWEFVGHMGEDVGSAGYEHGLLDRARTLAEALQTAMLAAMVHAGPELTHLKSPAARAERL